MAKNQAKESSRRLRRFFSEVPLPQEGQEVQLSPNQSHHLSEVHRLGVGQRCFVLDGTGVMAKAVIQRFTSAGEAVLCIEGEKVRKPAFPLKIRVFSALTQRYKFDTLVEKAQEMGIDELYPLETERTIVKMSQENQEKVLKRWQRKAQEAAKQSYSLQLIELHPPLSFKKALDQIPQGETVAFFHPSEEGLSFGEWYREIAQKVEAWPDAQTPMTLNVFIGPEGGFSDNEAQMISKQKNCAAINLGDTVLKVDTAFCGILASIKFLFSE